jgi:hypothetical protein
VHECEGPGWGWDFDTDGTAWRCPHGELYLWDQEYEGWKRVSEVEVTEEHRRRGRETFRRMRRYFE